MNIDLNHYKGNMIADEMLSNITLERALKIIKAFNPKLTQDGNQWCFIYGEMPNDCIVGFGDTPYDAMNDFVNNFYNEKIKQK